MTAATDPDLAAWQHARDPAAFQRLVERYAGLVATVCRRQLGRGQDADDAAQAVFIVLARRASALRPQAPLGPWLYGVTQQVCRNARRAAGRRTRHEHEAAMAAARQSNASNSAEATWEELRGRLDEALADLGAHARAVLVGHYIEGLPQAAVAARIGISEEAAKKRIQSAREQLRRWFARRGLTVGASALAAGLASEAPAAEPLLVHSCVQAGLHPAGAAAALAGGVGAVISFKTIATLLCILLAAGGAVFTVLSPQAQVGDPPPAPAPHTEQPGPTLARQLATRIDVLYRRDHLDEVLADLDVQVGLDCAVPPTLRQSTLFSYEARGVTVQAVLERLAREQGLRLAYHQDTVALWKPAEDAVIAGLTRRLHDPDLGARLESVFDLGQLADPRIYPPLFTALSGADADVARKALSVLGPHRDSLRCQRLAQLPIAALTAQWGAREPAMFLGTPSEQLLAIDLLGHSRDAQATAWLLERIDTPSRHRANLATALGATRDPRVFPVLRALLNQAKDPGAGGRVRTEAEDALANAGEEYETPITHRWHGPHENVARGYSALRLCRTRNIDLLFRLASTVDPRPVDGSSGSALLRHAAEGLRRNHDPRIAGLLLRLVQEGARPFQIAASRALQHFRDARLDDQMWNLAQSTADAEVRKLLLGCLAMRRDPRVLPGLIGTLKGLPLTSVQLTQETFSTAYYISEQRDPQATRFLLQSWLDIRPVGSDRPAFDEIVRTLRMTIDWRDPALGGLIEAQFANPDKRIQDCALDLAIHSGHPNATQLIIRRLADPETIQRLIKRLASRNSITVISDEASLLESGDPRLVPALARIDGLPFAALCNTGDPRAEEPLLRSLSALKADGVPVYRGCTITDTSLLARPRIYTGLLALLDDPRPSVRLDVAGPLVYLGTPLVASALASKLQPDDWRRLRDSMDYHEVNLLFEQYPELKALSDEARQAATPKAEVVPSQSDPAF